MRIGLPASHAEAMATFLQDLVRIPSLSTHEEAVAVRLAEEMRRVGFAEVWMDRIGNVIGRIGNGQGPKLLLDGHMDVVDVGDLARWFGPEVTGPVALHVAAKRYLVAVDPTYAAGLSPSSVRSLAVQGGPMDADERAAFEALPGFEGAVAVRRWDDEGKDPELQAPAFSTWEPMLRRLAR